MTEQPRYYKGWSVSSSFTSPHDISPRYHLYVLKDNEIVDTYRTSMKDREIRGVLEREATKKIEQLQQQFPQVCFSMRWDDEPRAR